MYTTSVAGEVRKYDITEEDAYHIAIQVLQEMEFETFQNPEMFKTYGFSKLYQLLIYKVCGTAERVYETKEVKNEN